MLENDIDFYQDFIYSTPDGEYTCKFVREFGNIRLLAHVPTIGQQQWLVEDLMNGRGYIKKEGATDDKSMEN